MKKFKNLTIQDDFMFSKAMTANLELTKKVSGFIQSGKPVLIPSSTEGSTKKFKITVDDSVKLTATDV